jgi:hypothetical protein
VRARVRAFRRLAAFSYVEVLVATALVALALVPALEALEIGITGSGIHESELTRHYHLVAKLEEVLARPFAELEAEEQAAGGAHTSYSDASGPDRRLVYLSGHDGDDADGDGDTSTGMDPGLLRVRVEIEATAHVLETLTTP